MTSIFHPDHPHFEVHKAFVECSFANPDCPPVVQALYDIWVDCPRPSWTADYKYRIKPRAITRTVTYAEPMRDVPADGTQVWFVNPSYIKPYSMVFEGDVHQIMALKNGMIFATESDAQSCYNALFGAQK